MMTRNEFIGEKLKNKYQGSYAYYLLELVTHAIMIRKGYPKDLGFICLGDYLYPWNKRDIRSEILFLSGVIPYYINTIKHRIIPSKSSVLISDLFWESDRYENVKKEIQCYDEVIGTAVINDFGYCKSHDKLDRKIHLGIRKGSRKLYKLSMEFAYRIVDISENGSTCSDYFDELSDYMDRLQDLMECRIRKIKKELIRQNVRLYITTTQYRISELLVILACYELGIRTKEWLHHGCVQIPINEVRYYRFADHDRRLNFVEEISAWGKHDAEWIKKYYYTNDVLYNRKPIFDYVGSPEINKRAVLEDLAKYERSKIISLFIPLELCRNDPDEYMRNEKIHAIVEGVKSISEKYCMNVYVRYHPIIGNVSYEYDNSLFRKYGFTVLDSTHESLIRCLCESEVLFSEASTTLIMAYNYGCIAYCFRLFDEDRYDFCGAPIHLVDIDELDKVELDMESDCTIALDEVNYSKLLK